MLSCAPLNKMIYPTSTAAAVLATKLTSSRAPSSVAPSETNSEISSADSDWSDIRSIALKLGVPNPDELHTERFKVDRQKLEQLIKAESSIDGMNGAEYFFDSIMKTFETYISWPCRLKVGAKSKKDPHVRIVGKQEEVQRAKERILASLDSRGTRVIMKMDVSYTDHSFIIGRGGNNIKRIMEDTSTHIHFPDSNRSNPTEKSNQVSLCGSLEGVEKARALVRLSTPLLISFELPILAPGRAQPDHESPYVNMIETKYNVQVIFSSRPKLHSALVLVKGSEKEAPQVKEATQLLIDYSCENVANQILVNMQLEISPQHHEIVKGKNNTNLLGIMERTKTKIIFPDLTDMNVKPLKKSQVTITGTIDGAYKARQQLLGNLPIALIFDFPDNHSDASEIMSLSTKYGVYVSLRQKQRQSALAIVVKGVEKFIDKIYEARHEILCLNTPVLKPEIPETYFSPKDKELTLGYRTTLTSLLSGYPDSPKTPSLITNITAHNQLTALGQNINNNNINCNNNNNSNNNNNNLLFSNQQQQQQLGSLAPGTPMAICAPSQKYLQMHNLRQKQQAQANHNGSYVQLPPPGLPAPNGQQINTSPRNSCHNTSGYQSYSSSTTSLEQAFPPYNNGAYPNNNSNGSGGGLRSHNSPDSAYSSEAGSRIGRRSSDGVLLGLGASGGITPMMPGSAETYRNLQYDIKNNRAFDYDFKRVMGFKAMERPPVSGELRTPNANWVGMALSRTSPAPLETVDDLSTWYHNGAPSANLVSGISSPFGMHSTTGIVDSTPTNRRTQLNQHKDIHSLLTNLGLEHYIKIFIINEIDLEIFTTLTEENLMELGISAFGARRRLLMAIHSLQANAAVTSTLAAAANLSNSSSPRFSGSAAPGAERRPSNQW